jgi:ABC-2 type transport system permease protein
MTILGPLLFGGFFAAMGWLMSMEDKETKNIAIIDETGEFKGVIPESETLKFDYLQGVSIDDFKKTFFATDYYAVLYIPRVFVQSPNTAQLLSDKQPNLSTKMHITNALEQYLKEQKLQTYNIENLSQILKNVNTSSEVRLNTLRMEESGEAKKSNTELSMALAYIGGLLIYMFIFIYGAQVMRGVIEEKTNRIVEVIISSVKPFQLMMGKIIGIALVGLSQFILWIILTAGILQVVQATVMPDPTKMMEQVGTQAPQSIMSENGVPADDEALKPSAPEANEMSDVQVLFNSLTNIPWGLVIGIFAFYFLFGYLLYGSLFAAIGSAVDNETDTQQFMLPITIPLIIGLLIMFNALNNPGSGVAYWGSIIPFTSPIVMMARVPFFPSWIDIAISMVLLVLTFLGTTWLAGKIYRVGILMYGKKVNYKELMKWLRYRN